MTNAEERGPNDEARMSNAERMMKRESYGVPRQFSSFSHLSFL